MIETTNGSNQTETTDEDSREEQEQQEEEQALVKLGLAHYADDSGCDESDGQCDGK